MEEESEKTNNSLFSEHWDECQMFNGNATDYKTDYFYGGFIVCLGMMVPVHLIAWDPTFNRTGRPTIHLNNHQSSGFKFDERFRTLINSSNVFTDDDERYGFLQKVIDCNYIWDQCIDKYCNKYQE